ncbi:MAG: hypothetical protein U0441_11085 [Polyangiaceae bacterium]
MSRPTAPARSHRPAIAALVAPLLGACALVLAAPAALAHPPPIPPNPLDPPYVPPAPEPPPMIEAPPAQAPDVNVSDDAEDKPADVEVRRAVDPRVVTGVETPEQENDDAARKVGNTVLFPLRESLSALFLLTRTASVIAEQQQIVPKINEFVREKRGEITIFPTLFFDPGRRPSAGAFMITGGPGGTSTSIRVGSGGPNEALLETRVALARAGRLPFSLVAESLYDMRTSLSYFGIGQEPEHDPRNHFRPMTQFREARYRHQRVRSIFSGGIRPSENTEVFLSTSVTTHIIDGSPDDGGRALNYVFVPGSITGGPTEKSPGRGHIAYTEIAVRHDTREDRGSPKEGAYVEGYVGWGRGLEADRTDYARFGFRGALFLAIYRATNILSPRLSVDRVAPLNKEPIPFYELPRENDFRGFHTRRDQLSTTASLDYRWGFAPQVSGRLFVDVNSVGPELVRLGSPRWAAGFGMDIYASAHDIGSWAFSFSPDGIGFSLSFGVPSSFGDRQHRE